MRPFLFHIAALIVLAGLSGFMAAFPAFEGQLDRTLNTTGPVTLEIPTGSGSIEVNGIAGSLRTASGSGSIQASGNPMED